MEYGWVKLYRKIEQNDFLMEDNTAFMVFMKLLLFADKHTGSYRTGQRMLAERCNLNYSTVYKALQRLESHGVIVIENHQKFSKIYITNWTVYQSNKEIDSLLEANVPIAGKHPSKRVTPLLKKTPRSRAVSAKEAPGKHTGSVREDYNKTKELEVDNNTTNVVLGDKKSPAKIDPHKELVSKTYYEAIKALDLPVTNHNTLRSKIAEMARDKDQLKIINYLTFMRDQFATVEWDYKPHVNEALDIYRQRAKIRQTFVKYMRDQKENEVVSFGKAR